MEWETYRRCDLNFFMKLIVLNTNMCISQKELFEFKRFKTIGAQWPIMLCFIVQLWTLPYKTVVGIGFLRPVCNESDLLFFRLTLF